MPTIGNIKGHGAGWGDYNGDGLIDLYVGVFNTGYKGPSGVITHGGRSMLFANKGSRFVLDSQQGLNIYLRSTGAYFADLDNDGDNDLYVTNMPDNKEQWADRKGLHLFENNNGQFKDVSERSGAAPLGFGARCASFLDYNGDALLDILVTEDPMVGFSGSYTKRSKLLRNNGNMRFSDVTEQAGFPQNIPGYGIAAADVNNDGWPDFALVGSDGANLLYLNDGHGKFLEAPRARQSLSWPGAGDRNLVCGVAFGDINRDGLLDCVIGPHYVEQWLRPVPLRLYLNKGIKNGVPDYEDITAAAGLKPMPLKAPHVELQDFDNDGWPDIYGSSVKLKDRVPYPYIARHEGFSNGVPQYRDYTNTINDYPNADDLKVTAETELTTYKERRALYMAAAPTGDYDNDGRLDILMLSWVPVEPTYLLHNETVGNNWLQVTVNGAAGVNRAGVGARVNIYKAGKAHHPDALLGSQEISIGYGYASGHAAIAHLGLGKETVVDVVITLPHQKGVITRSNVKANQRINIAN